MIGTDCTGSRKSNYHTITTTTAPGYKIQVVIKHTDIHLLYASLEHTFIYYQSHNN